MKFKPTLVFILLSLISNAAHLAKNRTTMQSKTIVFIHGLFMNDHSWMEWKTYFEEKGYHCIVPQYPLHKGNPVDLRTSISKDLGQLEYQDIVKHYEDIIAKLDHKPILIGHSVGGMLVQTLINKDLATMGICIDSAPPKGINCFKWSFIKANLPIINPFKGNSHFLPSVKWFHYAFCNTLSMEETKKLYNQFVVPESRNIPRKMTAKQGKINFKKPHAPLLFIAGEKDNITPASLNKKNVQAYKHKDSIVDYKEFEGRTHILCAQKNWEEITAYIHNWIESK